MINNKVYMQSTSYGLVCTHYKLFLQGIKTVRNADKSVASKKSSMILIFKNIK